MQKLDRMEKTEEPKKGELVGLQEAGEVELREVEEEGVVDLERLEEGEAEEGTKPGGEASLEKAVEERQLEADKEEVQLKEVDLIERGVQRQQVGCQLLEHEDRIGLRRGGERSGTHVERLLMIQWLKRMDGYLLFSSGDKRAFLARTLTAF